MDRSEAYTVLAVDDEEAVLTLLTRQLSNLPYVFIPTSSPAEALHILKTREIAVLLCDLSMPNIDGNAVLAMARDQNPNTVPIVISGNTDHNAIIRAVNDGGIWKYIVKPWMHDEIAGLVGEAVNRYAVLCHQQEHLTQLARDITSEHSLEKKSSPVGAVKKAILKMRGRAEEKGEDRGQMLGKRYRLIEVLGEGGMGTVYKADDLLLGMPVAVKILAAKISRDESAITTLKEEARIAMQLSHRHIVRIHNMQKAGGYYFLVMEYVEGRTFREILKRYNCLPLDTVLQVVRVCSDALAYAHRHGVLHRDLKPANLMLAEDGVLKIIDFGVACLVGKEAEKEDVFGTLIYMSPEQVRGEAVDCRTDVYSLGLIVYELLTGHNPFPLTTTDPEVIAAGVPPLEDMPANIRDVVERAVAVRRTARWSTVEMFSRALTDAARK